MMNKKLKKCLAILLVFVFCSSTVYASDGNELQTKKYQKQPLRRKIMIQLHKMQLPKNNL